VDRAMALPRGDRCGCRTAGAASACGSVAAETLANANTQRAAQADAKVAERIGGIYRSITALWN